MKKLLLGTLLFAVVLAPAAFATVGTATVAIKQDATMHAANFFTNFEFNLLSSIFKYL